MVSLTRTARLISPRRASPRPLLNPPSFSSAAVQAAADQGGRRRDSSRAGRAASPPRPRDPPPRRPVHRIKPHLAVKSSPSELFRTRTKWISQALAEGKHFPRELLLSLLDSRNIPPAQVALWVDVLAKRDPIYALQQLGLLESANSSEEVPSQSGRSRATGPGACPEWLYLSLPAMVTLPSHVPYLASQLLSPHFARLDEQNRGLFVARCIQHFLKVRHYVALREVVEWVAYTPAPPFQPTGPAAEPSTAGISSSLSFSRLLAALASERVPSTRASATPHSVLSPLVKLLRSTMTSRRVPPTLETFLPLFSPKLIPREPVETLKLLREMQHAGFEPKTEVLHRVMSVCARAGESKLVEALRQEIEAVKQGAGRGDSSDPRARLLGGARSPLSSQGGGGVAVRGAPLDAPGGDARRPDDLEVDPAEDRLLGEEAEEETWANLAGEERGEQRWTAARRRTEQKALDRLGLAEDALHEAKKVAGLVKEPAFLRTLGLTEQPDKTAKEVVGRGRVPRGEVAPAEEAQVEQEVEEQDQAARQPAKPAPELPDPPPSSSPPADIYATTTLLNPSVSLAYYATLRAYLDANMRSVSFPSPPFPFDNPAWTTFLSVIGRDPSIPTSALLEILRRLELVSSDKSDVPRSGYIPPRPNIRTYTAVLRSLVRRHAYQPALHLWRSLEARGWRPDAAMLDCTVRAFCGIGRTELARRHLDHYGHRLGIDPPELLVSDQARNPQRAALDEGLWRRAVRLDVIPFNSLLAHLTRTGQYDAAFSLFRGLEETYGVRPDVATLSIMLDAARYCSAAAGKGFGPGFEDLSSLSIREPLGSNGVSEDELFRAEGSRSRAVVDDRWEGVPAAVKMERFLWHDVLEANWQDADVHDPLYARWDREAVRGEGRGGLAGWIAARLGGGKDALGGADAASDKTQASSNSSPPPDWRPFASTLSPTPPSYPHFHPTDRVFRSLIQLVGYHGHPRTIPLLTAWMAHLGVVPSRWTLALALMYVEGEASIPPRRVDRWRTWLMGWLGKEAVPTEREIAWVRRGGRAEGDPELR